MGRGGGGGGEGVLVRNWLASLLLQIKCHGGGLRLSRAVRSRFKEGNCIHLGCLEEMNLFI